MVGFIFYSEHRSIFFIFSLAFRDVEVMQSQLFWPQLAVSHTRPRFTVSEENTNNDSIKKYYHAKKQCSTKLQLINQMLKT